LNWVLAEALVASSIPIRWAAVRVEREFRGIDMKLWYQWFIAAVGAGALAVTLALLALEGTLWRDALAQGNTIYVDADATGVNNGSSWEDAFTTLQPALDVAVVGDQIWVAEGIYTPTNEFSPGDLRSATFQLKNGVALYGGFDPTVGDVGWADRDWVNNVIILSGDSGTAGDPGDNSYHVFYHPPELALDGTAVLDGFTIIAGNANDISGPNGSGGGMYNDASNPALTNITFIGNSAGYGGGMYNHNSYPTLTNVTFSGNSAITEGGGMMNFAGSNPELTNVTFSGNTAPLGGGMSNLLSSSPTLTNVTFSGNSATQVGGGIENYLDCSPTLTNVTFSSNSSDRGGGMYNVESSPTIRNTILWGNTSQIYNYDTGSSPIVSDSVVQGGYASGTNIITTDPKLGALGDYGGLTLTIPLLAGSSAVDTGNDSICPTTDQRGVARPQGSQCDIGAYEKEVHTSFLPWIAR
jgi:hypothetical protein